MAFEHGFDDGFGGTQTPSIVDLDLDALLMRLPTVNRYPVTRLDTVEARYDYRYAGCVIYCSLISGDEWSVAPPFDSLAFVEDIDTTLAATRVLYGGRHYHDVTAGLINALDVAGYISAPSYDSGFSGGFK